MTAPILITGANGLLGSATVSAFAGTRRVVALVREAPSLPLPRDTDTVVHDLTSRKDPIMPEIPETIIHLAQSPRYRDFPAGAQDVFEVNVGSTQRLLDWAVRCGVRRFIYASTGGVYGHGEEPFREDDALRHTPNLGHYIASKRCGELLVESYGAAIIFVILRFFFVYGPGQRATMMIPRLISSVRDGRSVTLQGETGIRLNPVHVADAASAVEAASTLESSNIINVAGPEVLTLRDIAQCIGNATGRAPQFTLEESVVPRHLVGDTEKMTRLLKSAKTRFASGIQQLISRPASS